MRLVQISDTHLSAVKPHFAANWEPLAAWIVAQRPDLVIHTGDLTVDGAGTDADLGHCVRLMRDLGVPFRIIPGNHDVGEANHPRQPVNAARLTRWRAHFGMDRWFEDIGGWRLIGLNALLTGSGDEQEALQEGWLEGVMTAAGGRQIAWFLHKPLFLDDPDEPDTGYWSVKPEPRRRWLDRIRRKPVALVASGHLHKAHQTARDGVAYVWAPSSAFLVGPQIQPEMPGEKRLGAVLYEIEGAAVRTHIAEVPGLQSYWIDDVVQEVYPRAS
ncbi:MAG TPA: metallophosphoesterase [Stellaceae bacterium]|nr:metallophosphoesterase [Stellaceae bacterium]